jgi:hypothetical protein
MVAGAMAAVDEGRKLLFNDVSEPKKVHHGMVEAIEDGVRIRWNS